MSTVGIVVLAVGMLLLACGLLVLTWTWWGRLAPSGWWPARRIPRDSEKRAEVGRTFGMAGLPCVAAALAEMLNARCTGGALDACAQAAMAELLSGLFG